MSKEALILTIDNYPKLNVTVNSTTILNLSEQNLTEFPDLENRNIKILNVSKNDIRAISKIPKSIVQLDISNNRLNTLNFHSENLKFLNASNNQIRKFKILNLPGLLSLDLNRNNLVNVDLTTSIENTTPSKKGTISIKSNLIHLNLARNKICKIEFCKQECQHLLTSIDLSHNLLAKSPVFFFIDNESFYPFLQEMNLDGNYVAADNSYSGSLFKTDIIQVQLLQSNLFIKPENDQFRKLEKLQKDIHEKVILTKLTKFKSIEFLSDEQEESNDDDDEVLESIQNSESENKESNIQNDSATKIQALFRGYLVRKMFRDAEIENLEDTEWIENFERSTVADSIDITDDKSVTDSDVHTHHSNVSVFDYFSRPSTSRTVMSTNTTKTETRYDQISNYEQFIPQRKKENEQIIVIPSSLPEVSELEKPRPKHSVKTPESLKTENLQKEWNINEKTAELMLQRAKRMNKKKVPKKPKKPGFNNNNNLPPLNSRYRLPNK